MRQFGAVVVSAGLAMALVTAPAFAQIGGRSTSKATAMEKVSGPLCPTSPVSTTLDNGATIVWREQAGRACRRELHLATGEVVNQLWYGPTFTMAANASTAFADQLKPWSMWPLQVGKSIKGRFDGPGTQGSWLYKVTVEQFQKLTTPAGTFDVFVVTREEEALGGSFKSKLREWYAPELGVSVRTAYTDTDASNSTQQATSIRR